MFFLNRTLQFFQAANIQIMDGPHTGHFRKYSCYLKSTRIPFYYHKIMFEFNDHSKSLPTKLMSVRGHVSSGRFIKGYFFERFTSLLGNMIGEKLTAVRTAEQRCLFHASCFISRADALPRASRASVPSFYFYIYTRVDSSWTVIINPPRKKPSPPRYQRHQSLIP